MTSPILSQREALNELFRLYRKDDPRFQLLQDVIKLFDNGLQLQFHFQQRLLDAMTGEKALFKAFPTEEEIAAAIASGAYRGSPEDIRPIRLEVVPVTDVSRSGGYFVDMLRIVAGMETMLEYRKPRACEDYDKSLDAALRQAKADALGVAVSKMEDATPPEPLAPDMGTDEVPVPLGARPSMG